MTQQEKYLQEQLAQRPWIRKELVEQAYQMLRNGSGTVELFEEAFKKLDRKYYQVFDRMHNKAQYFILNRQIFMCRLHSEAVISRKYDYQDINGEYAVLITPVMNYAYRAAQHYEDAIFLVSATDNALVIPVFFEEEQSYRITIWKLDAEGNRHLFVEYTVYALEDDLFCMRYLKGDLHCHSTYSDGYEPPEQVACSARKRGCDFLAITDHNAYDGSVRAEKWVQENGGSLIIIRGEEISCEYSPMHILSLGAPRKLDPRWYSVSCIRSEAGENCLDERIEDIRKSASGIRSDPLTYACMQFLFDRIRENGGFSVLCHPMWKPLSYDGTRADAPLALVRDLVNHRRFDGFEVVSGSLLRENWVSSVQQLIAVEDMPIRDITCIGITDSHYYTTDPISGKHFTVVFSEDAAADSIVDALRHKRSVAVEIDDTGKSLCYGSLRYVLFTYFLLQNYFPARDLAAFEDGRSMESKLLCESRM